MNFEEDIKHELVKLLQKNGINASVKSTCEDLLLDYFTIMQKTIEPKQRTIYFHQKFNDEIENHSKKREILTIVDIAIKGGNLNVFQSKKLIQTRFFDHLQNEWNIFHFHLSLKKLNNSFFVKQVNNLLFAYVDDEKIVFLGTDTHREGVFGDIKWLEILHDCFPQIIEPFRDNEIKEIFPKLSALERQQLWNKGYTLGMTEVRGKIYHSPGIGRAASGHSVKITLHVNEIYRWMFQLEKQIEDCKAELSQLLNLKIDLNTFGIRIGADGLELFEKSSKNTILKYPEILITKEQMAEKINSLSG